MRPSKPTSEWMQAPPGGVCVVCGRALARAGRYWLTAYPDGVHHGCRAWELEPFPFLRDLGALRKIARAVREAWRLTLREGRWLAAARRRWPATARELADEWLARKGKLEQRINELRERIRF
jgi:hypothetical protein